MAASPTNKLIQWLDDRLGLAPFKYLAEHKQVPVHKHSFWYYMGGIALIFIVTQVVTGVLLMVYYIPEIESAHSTILQINSQIDFGWFIRSLHSWGANLLILGVFFHMFSAYLMKAYRPPREFTWLTGLALLVLMFAFGFTGYLLPWDEVSFFATKIGLDITSKAPFIGEYMANILRGGTDISQETLSRFFTIHIMVLPLLLLPLLGLHLWLVQSHGMSEPESVQKLPPEAKQYEKFVPTFALKDAMVWILVMNFLAILVALFPWGIGKEADPFAPAPMGIKPEWYFLAMFQFLKLLPPQVGPIEGEQFGMMLFGLVGVLFALVPFVDRGQSRLMSQIAHWYGIIIIILFVFFTIWGYIS
jgi:cytochrome b6